MAGNWVKPAAIGGGAIALVGILLASIFGGSGGGSGRGEKVQVESASKRTITARVKATGEITAERKVGISTKVIGEIVALPVHEGSEVKTGDILIQIERKQFEAQRDQARSALSQAEVSIKRLQLQTQVGKKNLERAQELSTKGFGSETELENAQVAYSSAQVELEAQEHAVEQSRSMLQRANDDLERTTIRSPMDGRVIQLNTEKGETAIPGSTNLPGSQLMTVADMSHLVAEVDVSESDVVRLEVGQKAQIVVDALGEKPLAGRVSEIGSSGRKDASTGVVKFRVKVALETPDPALHPSMTAKVNVLTASHVDVISVPIQAVVKRRLDGTRELTEEKDRAAWAAADEKDVVYLLSAGRAKITPVKTGASDEVRVEVQSGITEGGDVIVGPYRTLKDLHDGADAHADAPAAKPAGSPKEKPANAGA